MTALDPVEVRGALVEVTRATWSAFLDVEARPIPVGCRQPTVGNAVVSIVDFEGQWSGALSLTTPPHNAITWATTMFGIDRHGCTDADIRDATGELANILAGGVKPLLDSHTMLTPPRVECGVMGGRRASPNVITAVRFAGTPVGFVVALHGPTATPDDSINKTNQNPDTVRKVQ